MGRRWRCKFVVSLDTSEPKLIIDSALPTAIQMAAVLPHTSPAAARHLAGVEVWMHRRLATTLHPHQETTATSLRLVASEATMLRLLAVSQKHLRRTLPRRQVGTMGLGMIRADSGSRMLERSRRYCFDIGIGAGDGRLQHWK